MSAFENIANFVKSYVRHHPRQPLEDSIHGVDVGTEYEAELTVSDLRRLLEEHAAFKTTLKAIENWAGECVDAPETVGTSNPRELAAEVLERYGEASTTEILLTVEHVQVLHAVKSITQRMGVCVGHVAVAGVSGFGNTTEGVGAARGLLNELVSLGHLTKVLSESRLPAWVLTPSGHLLTENAR